MDDAEYRTLRAALDAEFAGRSVQSLAESLAVTPLGQQFLDTCVRARGRQRGGAEQSDLPVAK